MKRCLALIICAVMLLGGCREGGYDLSSGYSRAEYDEFNVGERYSSRESSAYSSSSFESSRSSSISSTSINSTSTSSSSASASSSNTSTSISSSSVISSRSSSSVSTSSAASSQDITVIIPSSSETTAQNSSAPTILPEEPDRDNVGTSDDTSFDIGSVGGDMPANNGGVFDDPSESTSSAVSSESSSSTELPEPEPAPEPPVSPYDYEGLVYVASSGKGTKYHLNPGCSNMKGTVEMYVPEALEKGFTPCKKCWEL